MMPYCILMMLSQLSPKNQSESKSKVEKFRMMVFFMLASDCCLRDFKVAGHFLTFHVEIFSVWMNCR